MTPVKPCRCGAPRDTRGLCTHCDYPTDRCPRRCAHCWERDSHCEVCKTKRPTPAAGLACTVACRAKEAEARG